jgi:hypothetical protein
MLLELLTDIGSEETVMCLAREILHSRGAVGEGFLLHAGCFGHGSGHRIAAPTARPRTADRRVGSERHS